MTAEEKKRLITRIADEIWNRGDLTVIDEIRAPDANYQGPHMPGGTGDREKLDAGDRDVPKCLSRFARHL